MLRAALIAGLIAFCPLAAAAQGPTHESSHDDPFGRELNYFRKSHDDRVPLLTEKGRGLEIRRVLIHLGNEVFGVDTSAGLETRNENRVRLTGVPVLGQLFHDRFSQDDLKPRARIGTVYHDAGTLYVEIDPDQRTHPITQVVILNQDKAFFLAGALQRTRVQGDPYALPIGKAFVNDGETLLLLIQPSVLETNVFDKLL